MGKCNKKKHKQAHFLTIEPRIDTSGAERIEEKMKDENKKWFIRIISE